MLQSMRLELFYVIIVDPTEDVKIISCKISRKGLIYEKNEKNLNRF